MILGQELQKRQSNTMNYLTIGHCCHDKVNADYVLGGSASYCSFVAKSLGYDTIVLTSVGTDFLFQNKFDEANIHFYNKPAAHTTQFENKSIGNERSQKLLAKAHNITKEDKNLLPDNLADIVHLGPICNEVDIAFKTLFPNAIIGANIQGWLRHTKPDHTIFAKEMEWNKLLGIDIVFLSDEDIRAFPTALDQIRQNCPIVVVTHGDQGATVYHQNGQQKFSSFPVAAVDTVGAGDVFSTAFLVTYAQDKNLDQACIFANCAASYIVEGYGLDNLPTLEMIEQRVVEYLQL